jgi:hypothetical protein
MIVILNWVLMGALGGGAYGFARFGDAVTRIYCTCVGTSFAVLGYTLYALAVAPQS